MYMSTERREKLTKSLDHILHVLTRQYQPKKVILFGISRGAWICFSTMAQQNLPIAGAVLLSTPVSNGKAAIKSFSNRTKEYLCKLRDPKLLIYGRNDPMQKESISYYVSRCKENRVPCNCHIIDNANHSFFHYKWKEQIFDITRNWLISATGQNVK